jgi:cytochrome c oxidase assembly protein subunit 11
MLRRAASRLASSRPAMDALARAAPSPAPSPSPLRVCTGASTSTPPWTRAHASAGGSGRGASSPHSHASDRRASRVAAATAKARGAAASGGLYLAALTVGMVGATYASVPLYRMFCQATGFGGTTRRKTVEDKLAEAANLPADVRSAARNRDVRISFNADVAEGMQWRFVPTQKSLIVKPGETTLAFFTAKNNSERDVTGVATYNVQPNKAGSYFNKVQCFCFEEQRLRAGEEVDMPVFFYLDPEFASDPAMADVNDVCLSYTFFRSDDFDDAAEAMEGRATGGEGVRLHGKGEVPEGIKTHAALNK